MSITWLEASSNNRFPPVEQAFDDGLLAAGGDLSTDRLLNAYQHGIFPWFNKNDPILWWCPDPRMVLFTDQVRISKSLKKHYVLPISVFQLIKRLIKSCWHAQNQDRINPWILKTVVGSILK